MQLHQITMLEVLLRLLCCWGILLGVQLQRLPQRSRQRRTRTSCQVVHGTQSIRFQVSFQNQSQCTLKLWIYTIFILKPNRSKEATEEQQRLHQRGCNCKRSGCLKNYCECYEAKISCSANCRCLGKLIAALRKFKFSNFKIFLQAAKTLTTLTRRWKWNCNI